MKINNVRKKLDELGLSPWLMVDGGITIENLPETKEAGANVFVAATSVFKHPEGTMAGIKSLQDVIARSEGP